MRLSSQSFEIDGWLGPELEKTYYHVPFDLPGHTSRLEVTLSYTERIGSNPTLTGGNTIDLGVFDERGIDFLNAGFRGWSGSERDKFFITSESATPGYLAGPLNPGRWHVLLGLYKIAPNGCQFKVTIYIETSPTTFTPTRLVEPPRHILPSSPPPARDAPWLKGELHCHTFHSDGSFSTSELVNHARQRELDFLAIADHNTISSQLELTALDQPGLVLVHGVEATTFKGHFVIWGIPDWIDFRVQNPQQMEAAIQAAKDSGGLTTCGHPKPFGPGWDYLDVANFDCVEVWNGPWTGLNTVSLQYWLDLIASGRKIPAVGGSDFHREGETAGGKPRDLGTPTNWVYVPGEINEQTILSAIRAGHVSLSEDINGPFLKLSTSDESIVQGDTITKPLSEDILFRIECLGAAGSSMQLHNQKGMVFEKLVKDEHELIEVLVPTRDSLFIRAELRSDMDWMRALTNPIYIR